MGIEVLPPDINESYMEFAVVPETNNIRFGLGAVKNVGKGPVEKIIAARQEGGHFKSIEDFAQRVDATVVNKKVMESLIKCGAFDSLGDRDLLLNNVDKITAYAGRVQKNALSGQIDIFGTLSEDEKLPPISLDAPSGKIDPRAHLMWEKELLGLYISTHPLDDFNNYLRHKTQSIKDFDKSKDGHSITTGGIITTMRKIYTKKNDPMAFVGIETLDGDVELIVFPKSYQKHEDLWAIDNVIEVKGKINARDRDGRATDELKIIVDSAKVLNADTARMWLKPQKAAKSTEKSDDTNKPQKITIKLNSISDTNQLMSIKSVLDSSPGSDLVVFEFTTNGQKLKFPNGVNASEVVMDQLKSIAGELNVIAKTQELAKT